MKYLKTFNENIVDIKGASNKPYRFKSLPHRGDDIEPGKISIFQQDWFDKLLPDTFTIYSNPGISKLNFDQSLTPIKPEINYVYDKNDCTIGQDIVQFNYWYEDTKQPGNELKDGQPSVLQFDICFVKNTGGIKLLVDITHGDNIAAQFSIEAPNKINIIHYTGIGSIYDKESHFGFTNKSIEDLVKFFNAFTHGIKLTPEDLSFLDEHNDTYKHIDKNPHHLYTDDSKLVKFGNALKESENKQIFLIIDNSMPPEHKYLPGVIDYLTKKNIPYRVASTPGDIEKYNSEFQITGALSTGSDYRVSNPKSDSEYATNEKALEILSCPILAMCYGFQSMAKYYGSEITGGEELSGLFNLTDADEKHFLFRGVDLDTIKFNFCFHDYPTSIPSGFTEIADLEGKCAGISNISLDRYGILFHPEDFEETYIIFDNFVKYCYSKNRVQSSNFYQLENYQSFSKSRFK